MNKKVKIKAYQEAFKYLSQNKGLIVVDEFKFDAPKTKQAVDFLKSAKVEKALIVLPQGNDNAAKSFRNLKDVKVVNDNNINIFDILKYGNVVLEKALFEQLKERYAL